MKNNKITAIVLKRVNYGEADRILQLLTQTGKISVMAKGVRKEKSRLSGGVELFSICEVSVAEGKGDLGVLTSARLIKFFDNIIKDYDRMSFAYKAIKMISEISDASDGSECYDILAEVLAGLDAKSIDLNLIEAWFYLRFADLTGYGLNLYSDINNDKIIEAENYIYDVSEKGLMRSVNGNLNSNHIKLLRLIAAKPIRILAQIGGIQDVIKDCAYVARGHVAV